MRLFASICLLFCLALTVGAQFVPDCANCSNASWGEQWSPGLGVCVSSHNAGCGNGCNCWMSLYGGYGLKVKQEFFGGGFVRNEKGEIVGFRIDRPGPLSRNHVKPGDVAYRINGRKPNRKQFGTPKRPIRRVEASWGDDGRLRLRFSY